MKKENHSLIRARSQIALSRDIWRKLDSIQAIFCFVIIGIIILCIQAKKK
ncbi:MAG: hypothetical protein Q4F31_07465 [Eubacteriales bacterium]|nr:hypothetical protein [Eubacteriales bacterium]